MFNVDAKVLRDAIAPVDKAIPAKPSHPILGCYKLETCEDELMITGFDLSKSIQHTIPVEATKACQVCVDANLFKNVLATLEGYLSFTLSQEDETTLLVLNSLSGKCTFNTLSVGEYPSLPSLPDGEAPVELSPEDLKAGLSMISSASTEESKEVLTGVNIKFFANKVAFAATDGHRLAVTKTNLSNPLAEGWECTIPAIALSALRPLLTDVEDISVTIAESLAYFDNGKMRCTARILEGNYPAYEQLIPQQFNFSVTCDREAFLKTVKRLLCFADLKYLVGKFEFSNGTIIATAESDGGNEIVDKLICNGDGDDVGIGFNLKYLVAGLKDIPGDEIKISGSTPMQPVLIQSMVADYTYLVMPVQIRE